MSGLTRDSLTGGRSIPVGSSLLLQQQQRRRIRGLAAGGGRMEQAGDEGLDLFSRNRRTISVAGVEEPDGLNVPHNLGRISTGSAKLTRSVIDDLISAADLGKHDYDWLLTPPGTPLVSTLDTSDTQLPSVAPRANPSARLVSTTKASRFSAPQPENKHPTRPARSSSVIRPSIATCSSSQVSSNSSRTSILNTSTVSVTSSRPSTPGNSRSTSSSSNRPSATASSRPTPSRPSTPVKTRPAPASAGDKVRSSHSSSSRPSSPSPRSHISATSNSNPLPVTSAAGRASSGPSTPTRWAPLQSSAPLAGRSPPSVGLSAAASGRRSAPASRPSSPGPRVRPPSQTLAARDFPLDVLPNLRTKIPERPASAGRARPGLSLTGRSNASSEAAPPVGSNRRQSVSPVVTRGRLPENSPRMRLHSNGHEPGPPDIRPMVRESAMQKPIKATAAAESSGFGRTISKKSLDMALRHMDIRRSMGGVRGASLFPQSIRSTAAKLTPTRESDPRIPVSINGTDDAGENICNGKIYTGYDGAAPENEGVDLKSTERGIRAGRASEPDIYESSRYESLLLKEDARSMNWLHSVEDKSHQSPVFDLRFELLPEPFVLL